MKLVQRKHLWSISLLLLASLFLASNTNMVMGAEEEFEQAQAAVSQDTSRAVAHLRYYDYYYWLV